MSAGYERTFGNTVDTCGRAAVCSRGRVVRASRGVDEGKDRFPGMGVEFVGMSALARAKLIDFLNMKTAAASA